MKSETEYHSSPEYQEYMKSYHRDYMQDWLTKNPEAREKAKRRSRIRSNELADFITDYKRIHPCKICGESDWRVLDFHHQTSGPHKVYPHRAGTIKRLQKELENCDVLCANCHRRTHYIESRTVVDRRSRS